MPVLIVGLSTVLLVFRGDNGVVLWKPECVDSNTVNKRMSTSWGMTQPLCPVQNEWQQKHWWNSADAFTALPSKRSKSSTLFDVGLFFGGEVSANGGFFFLYHENNKRHSEKKKTLSSSSCHSTSNKRVTTALKRHFRRSNASVAWW